MTEKTAYFQEKTLYQHPDGPSIKLDENGLPTSNKEVLQAVFDSVPSGQCPMITSFAGDPKTSKAWGGQALMPDTPTDDPTRNWYTTLALYVVGGDGLVHHKKENCAAVLGVMLDDVGTAKTSITLDGLRELLPPSMVVETSPDNYQASYLFDAACTVEQVKRLNEGIIALGFCDKGATSPATRWQRLPFATNGKNEFECKLVEFEPKRRYPIAQIAKALGVMLVEHRPAPRPSVTPTHTQADEYSRALHALQSISSDCEYPRWFKLCASAKAAGLSEGDIRQWSATSDKYELDSFRKMWASIEDGKYTAGSLFHEAHADGWQDPQQKKATAPALSRGTTFTPLDEAAPQTQQASPLPPVGEPPAMTEDEELLKSAALAIPPSATLGGKHCAYEVIAYAVRHHTANIAEDVGLHIVQAWDAMHCPDRWLATKTFTMANPNYGGRPLGKASVYKMAQQNGWVKPPEPWADPLPLPNALPPVASFDPELLPEVLRPWVLDIAHRMQCPPDFTAVGALVALSSLIGARAVIAPKQRDDWRVAPNLWGLIVGRPSVMKSPALAQCMAPLKRLEATENERHNQALKEWDLDKKMGEIMAEHNAKKVKELAKKDPAAARALLSQDQEDVDEPVARRYVVNDSTVEALGVILESNPWGVLAYRDELHGLLKSLDREGQEGSRGFYLQAYDGNQSYTFDRIMRGRTHLERVCLALLGGIQPAKLQSYVRDAVTGGEGDDGLLQRFGLAVWPDAKSEFRYVDQWPDTPAKQTVWTVFERLNALQPATPDDAQEWRFSPNAQAMFKEWMTAFETRIRGDGLHDAMVSHLGKYRKLVPALALLFALIDTPDTGCVVHETELARALAWSEYLESHANRIYAAAMMPETAGAESLLSKIKSGKLMDSDGVLMKAFAARDVAQKHWAGLGTPDEVNKAAALLADYGWLRKEATTPTSKGGRPSVRYEVHPALMGGK